MKPLKEYDYDLWTSVKNGEKKCWVRVKRTGEVSEVSQEVLRFLRTEEKKIRRENEKLQDQQGNLYLNLGYSDETGVNWLVDPRDFVSEVVSISLIEELERNLSDRQMDIFRCCLIDGMGLRDYARFNHISFGTVASGINAIRKKFKKIYFGTLSNANKMSVDK